MALPPSPEKSFDPSLLTPANSKIDTANYYADVRLREELDAAGIPGIQGLTNEQILVVLQGHGDKTTYHAYELTNQGGEVLEAKNTIKVPESIRDRFEGVINENFMQFVEALLPSTTTRFRIMNVLHADIGSGLGNEGLAKQVYKYGMRVLGLASGYDFVLVPASEVEFVKTELIPAFRDLLPKELANQIVRPERVFGFKYNPDNFELDITCNKADVIKEIKKELAQHNQDEEQPRMVLSPFLVNPGLKPLMTVIDEADESDKFELVLPYGIDRQDPLEELYQARQKIEDKVDFLENAGAYGLNVPTGETLNYQQNAELTTNPELINQQLAEFVAVYDKLFPNPDTEVVLKESFSASGMGMFRFANREALLNGLPKAGNSAEAQTAERLKFLRMMAANKKLRLEQWQQNVVAVPGIALSVRKDKQGRPIIRCLANSDMIISDGKVYEGSRGNSRYFTQEVLDQAIRAAYYACQHGYEGPLSVDLIVTRDPETGELKPWINEVNSRQTGQFTINNAAYITNNLVNSVIDSNEKAGQSRPEAKDWQVVNMDLPPELCDRHHDVMAICRFLNKLTGATIMPTNYFRGFTKADGTPYDKVQMHFVEGSNLNGQGFTLGKLVNIFEELVEDRVNEIQESMQTGQPLDPQKSRPSRQYNNQVAV